jgi:hypothetical protein
VQCGDHEEYASRILGYFEASTRRGRQVKRPLASPSEHEDRITVLNAIFTAGRGDPRRVLRTATPRMTLNSAGNFSCAGRTRRPASAPAQKREKRVKSARRGADNESLAERGRKKVKERWMVKTMEQRAKEEAAFITDHGRSTDSQTDTSSLPLPYRSTSLYCCWRNGRPKLSAFR